jgi:hypothetical protein
VREHNKEKGRGGKVERQKGERREDRGVTRERIE